jgi:RNA polymerase subunit RPABC4/transcription elongation factor Spt4
MGFFDSLFGKKKEEKKKEEPVVKKICPVCGKEFTGKGMDVNDGIICMDCWGLVCDDFEAGILDEDKEFYIAPIKAAVLAKKGELAAEKEAKAKKPEVCPICGGKMPRFMAMEVKDGFICDECLSKFNQLEEDGETDKELENITLKELAALIARSDKQKAANEKRKEQDTCPICGSNVSEKSTGSLWGDIKRSVKDEIPKFVLLKDNQKICAECAEKVRLLYPILYSKTYDGDGMYNGAHIDTLNNITLADFRKALEDVNVKRQQLKEQYGSCEAVLSVGSVGRDFENVRSNPGKKEYRIRGKILYGKASKGNLIHVIRDGFNCTMRIERLRQITGFEEYSGNAVDSVGEGYYAIVTVAEDTSCIYPGDTLLVI